MCLSPNAQERSFPSLPHLRGLSCAQHNAKIKALQSDSRGEYLSRRLSNHLAQKGTVQKLTSHDTPHENGVAERLNCMLLDRVCAMLHVSRLPEGIWGEALQHAVWLKNRSSTKALHDSTSYETLTNLKPCLTDQHTWGQKVWVHDPTNSKLSMRAKEGQWMGFNNESHA